MKAFEKRRQMAGQQGFTLIELLIVIAILGILAAVVVFAVGNVTDNASEKACQIEARTIETASEAFKADNNGVYPAAEGDLVPEWLQDSPSSAVSVAYDATGATKPVVSSTIPNCPA
jgi:prepilin-type N-terminal cleavage/methylation domain-containing protein